MTEHWLHRFFKPRGMAIVGATEDRTRFGFRYLHNILNFGRRERVYPVNPRAETILGLPCYGSVRDLPETPDHVGIIVAAERVGGVIADCIAKGVPFATIFTGGFGEAGTEAGRLEEARLVAMARAGGLRLMGPNCNGAINFVDRIPMASTATVGEAPQPPGDIGIIGMDRVNSEELWPQDAQPPEVFERRSCLWRPGGVPSRGSIQVVQSACFAPQQAQFVLCLRHVHADVHPVFDGRPSHGHEHGLGHGVGRVR